jgi:hypothetical protein
MLQNTYQPIYQISGNSFPWDGQFAWNLVPSIFFGFGKQSAFIWGIQFMRSQFTAPVTLIFSIGYFPDTVYDG